MSNISEIKFAHYGEPRGFVPTDEEQQMFDIIGELTQAEKLIFVKRAKNYVSASIGPTDVARFKFTKKAKWILLPYLWNEKAYIEDPNDIRAFKDGLLESVEIAKNCK